ncbi:hypothetical protein QF049_003887 [Paenibacillus sp. W4I10]|uniref:hypothetical protein n=1 Tax=Paenibacillus sp. W4I10 TaxID=3042298 RepID=UPI00277E23F5|nr:hypothetical protein [Paenibacillus sp. W4I10]MDQ0722626.1 hypothetical protein [Paenibacillus sp. W4I10]
MSKPSSRENGPVRLFGLYSQIIRVEAIINNPLPELLQVPLFLLLGQVYLIR